MSDADDREAGDHHGAREGKGAGPRNTRRARIPDGAPLPAAPPAPAGPAPHARPRGPRRAATGVTRVSSWARRAPRSEIPVPDGSNAIDGVTPETTTAATQTARRHHPRMTRSASAKATPGAVATQSSRTPTADVGTNAQLSARAIWSPEARVRPKLHGGGVDELVQELRVRDQTRSPVATSVMRSWRASSAPLKRPSRNSRRGAPLTELRTSGGGGRPRQPDDAVVPIDAQHGRPAAGQSPATDSSVRGDSRGRARAPRPSRVALGAGRPRTGRVAACPRSPGAAVQLRQRLQPVRELLLARGRGRTAPAPRAARAGHAATGLVDREERRRSIDGGDREPAATRRMARPALSSPVVGAGGRVGGGGGHRRVHAEPPGPGGGSRVDRYRERAPLRRPAWVGAPTSAAPVLGAGGLGRSGRSSTDSGDTATTRTSTAVLLMAGRRPA